jgi:serine/threonine protein kinase
MNDVVGKYRIIRLIMKGTFSSVYECEHIMKRTKAVIKMESDAHGKKLMEHELQLYLFLQNKPVRIPKIKATGTHGEYKYLILERLDRSLSKYTEPFDIKDLFCQVHALHQQGIVHRDIKPDNFVMGFDHKVYLIDLGLDAVHANEQELHHLVGNQRYASPKCYLPVYVYDYVDDYIALIYMILDMLYGYLPWDQPNVEKTSVTDISTYYPSEAKYLTDLHERCKRNDLDDDIMHIVRSWC